MQKRINRKSMLTLYSIILLMLFVPFSCGFASDIDNTVRYIEPQLPSGTVEYDPEYPENLLVDQLYARSAILVEASTGEVIFEKNPDEILYPASTTKILTSLLGLLMGDTEQLVYLTDTANNVMSDSSTIGLEVGESINFLDLIYGTMLVSGNEGANLIAETVAGSIDNFVFQMNQAVAQLGCTNTNFVNAHGYHDPNHYTTVRDMAKIAGEAMKNETFRKIVATYNFSLPRSNLNGSRVLVSGADALLNPNIEENTFYYPYAAGIKTGFTSPAGYCFVGFAEKDNVELISVVFYTSANGRWLDTTKLMEYGFSQFISVTPQELYAQSPIVLETTGYSLEDEDLGRLKLVARTQTGTRTVNIVATRTEMENMSKNLLKNVYVQYERDFVAPIQEGEKIGTMTYYPTDGGAAVVYDLVADRTIEVRDNLPLTIEQIANMVKNDPNPLPPLSFEVLFLLLWPFILLLIIVIFIIRIFKKNKKHKKITIPKPKNRYFQ